MAKSCPEKGKKGRQGKGESKGRLKGKGKGKIGKAWVWSQKGKEKGKGLQSMNTWDEWDHNDEYTSVPVQSLSCGDNSKKPKHQIWRLRPRSGKFV